MANYNEQRIEKLQTLLADTEIDIVAINASQSQVYYSGLHFHLMERPAVLLVGKDGKTAFIYPEFESRKLDNTPVKVQPFAYNENKATWGPAFKNAISYFDISSPTIGVEPTCMRFLEMDLLKFENRNIKFCSASHLFEKMRAIKDPSEIGSMKEAVRIAEISLEATFPFIKPGSSELSIANELVVNLLRNGSDPEMPFAPIVAGGPNSANPHSVPSSRELTAGDMVIIDWGARVNGYISDITRTFAIGSIDSQLREVYETVKAANASARAAGKQKMTGAQIDDLARSIIQKAGYGSQFTHRTGHGIGLEAHETPYISSDNFNTILPGNTFTIEPGVYLGGKGGVRIEDDMHALEGSLETLTTLDRELTIL